MAGKFECYRDKAGEYRFRLKAANSQVVLSSEGYKSKAACMNGIESVRKNSQDQDRFEVRTAANVEDALRVLTSERIDLVLSDIQMPGRGGMELLQDRGDDEGRNHHAQDRPHAGHVPARPPDQRKEDRAGQDPEDRGPELLP